MKKVPLVAVMALVACSSSSTPAPTPTGTVDSGTPAVDTGINEANLIKFKMNVDVPISTEVHRCEVIQMPKTPDGSDIYVKARSHEYTPGSHHYLLFRTDFEKMPAEYAGKQVDCFEGAGMMKHGRGYIAGGQKPTERLEFPPGIAMKFKSEEVLIFQAHYVNAGSKVLNATVNVQFETMQKADVKEVAGITNFYNPFITVAPKSTGRAPMRCPIPKDITILGAGPHMHRRGVGYKAFLDEVGKPPSTTPFYTTDDWEHPVNFVGPLVVKAGSHIRFECTYKNDDDRSYIQGQSATENEMCMFSAQYFPEMTLEESQCRGMDQHGTGTMKCGEQLNCVSACKGSGATPGVFPPDFSECFQKCFTGGCASASAVLLPQLNCIGGKCAEPCALGSEQCRSCVIEKCPAEGLACASHTCEGG